MAQSYRISNRTIIIGNATTRFPGRDPGGQSHFECMKCRGQRKLPAALRDTLMPSQRSVGVAIESFRTNDIGLLIGLQLVRFEENAASGPN
jgi:hypothetical protein